MKQLLAGVCQYAFGKKVKFSKPGLLFSIKGLMLVNRTSSLERLPDNLYHQIVSCTSFIEFTLIGFSHSLVTFSIHLPVSVPA